MTRCSEGVLLFSDGSTVADRTTLQQCQCSHLHDTGTVGHLTPLYDHTSERLDIDVGLAEFQVFEAGTTNLAPVANAGQIRQCGGGQAVTLDGT